MARGSGDGRLDKLNDFLSLAVPYAVMSAIFFGPLSYAWIELAERRSSVAEAMRRAFDEDAWRAAGPSARERMVQDLARSGSLTGVPVSDVIDRLGNPDRRRFEFHIVMDRKWGRMTSFSVAWNERERITTGEIVMSGQPWTLGGFRERYVPSESEADLALPIVLPDSSTWEAWGARERTEFLVRLALQSGARTFPVATLSQWDVAGSELTETLIYDFGGSSFESLHVESAEGRVVDFEIIASRYLDSSSTF